MTGPEQHAATVREALLDAGHPLGGARLAALDELVALAGRADELEAAVEAGRLVPLDASAVRLKAAEARADELQRERDFWERSYRQEHRTRHSMEDTIEQARREADQLRAALREILGSSPTRKTTTDRAPKWVQDIANAALAGVQADNKDSA